MEQQQIPELMREIERDPSVGRLAIETPSALVARGFSPRVIEIVSRLIPYLSLGDRSKEEIAAGSWWF
ncbi:MAG TPA: hypothetical protein VKR42_11460 [Ktedonobacteraceae bacterium]|nr:hypothetical protein [Ktedonobacteraceae bacterium]